jgi:hypothetical protein
VREPKGSLHSVDWDSVSSLCVLSVCLVCALLLLLLSYITCTKNRPKQCICPNYKATNVAQIGARRLNNKPNIGTIRILIGRAVLLSTPLLPSSALPPSSHPAILDTQFTSFLITPHLHRSTAWHFCFGIGGNLKNDSTPGINTAQRR